MTSCGFSPKRRKSGEQRLLRSSRGRATTLLIPRFSQHTRLLILLWSALATCWTAAARASWRKQSDSTLLSRPQRLSLHYACCEARDLHQARFSPDGVKVLETSFPDQLR